MSTLFKRLTRGLKFNETRFVNDAVKLQILPTVEPSLPNSVERKKKGEAKPTTHQSKKRKREEIDESSDLNLFGSVSHNESKNELTPSLSKNNKKSKKDAQGNQNEGSIDLEQHKEKIKQFRKAHRIHIWGEDLPDPIESFDLIPGITSKLLQNINSMGYHSPTPIQMLAIPSMLSGRELLACAPTGSGKTAAFLLPLIIQLLRKPEKVGFRAVLLSPTLELAKQTYRDCIRLSEGTGLLTFMINKKDIAKNKFKTLTNCDILVSTPNRLVHLLSKDDISFKRVEYLIVDECDHLFESGFESQLGTIYSHCNSTDVKRAFFSATVTHGVEQFCGYNLKNHIRVAIGDKSAAVDLIKQELIFTGDESGKLMAMRELFGKGIEPPMLIFVQNQERCDELFSELTYLSVPCAIIHAGKTITQREKIIEGFREGKIWVLICTALLARGMDFPAVKVVLNFDLPVSHIQYIHSIGRTGRAGQIGRAITFFTEDDREKLRKIAQVLENSGFPTPPYMLKLKRSKRKNPHPRPANRQSLSRMSGYDYAKNKRLLQIVKQSAAKKKNGSSANGDEKKNKKLKNLEKQLEKEKKCRAIETNLLQKRKENSKNFSSKKKSKHEKNQSNIKTKDSHENGRPTKSAKVQKRPRMKR